MTSTPLRTARPGSRSATALPPSDARTARLPGLVAAVVAGGIFVLHALHYRPFLADDALISLRYARRLLAGQGLTWTDGAPVEGYSNLLWVLLTSALGAFGIDLVTAARGLGLALALAAVGLVAWNQARSGGGSNRAAIVPGLAGGLVLALSGPLAVWAAAGLETALVAALLAAAVVLATPLCAAPRAEAGTDPDLAPGERRRALSVSLPLALLVLSRPDGPLFVGAVALAVLLARGPSPRTLRLCGWIVALPVAAWAGQQAFRLAYYHAWVPNPARAKIAFTAHRLESGLHYVWSGLDYFWPLWLLAATGAVLGLRDRAERGFTLLVLVPLLAWTAYVIVIGGDFFPGYRHLVPSALLAAFLAGGAARALWRRVRPPAVAAAGLAAALALFGSLQLRDPENARANRETWVWAGESTGLLLKRAFGPAQPLLAVVSAGCFPYWSELPSLDMLGLNDPWLPLHPPPTLGQGWPGHELGDPDYILEREPDLIQFSGIRNTGRTGFFRVEQELARLPKFLARYELVTFRSDQPREAIQSLYVRRDSPRIGIVRREGSVRVPAYLLLGDSRSYATLDAEGRLGVETSRDRPVRLERLALPRGRWRVRTDPEAAGLLVAARAAGDSADFEVVAGTLLAVESDSVDLLVAGPEQRAVHLRALTLERVRP